jgi:NAD+ kinase
MKSSRRASGKATDRRVRFRRVGLVAKVVSAEAVRLVRSLEKALARRGVDSVFDAETAAAVGRPAGPARDQIARGTDLVLIAGGDGTMLSVARDAPETTPVLGINVGLIGFLAGLRKEEALDRLDEVLAGGFRKDKRGRLDVRFPGGPRGGRYRALNDAVLSKETTSRISAFSLSIGGRRIASFRGDGVIVATPTGSTAYSFAAGGPIVSPRHTGLLVTPVAPHAAFDRAVFLHPDETLRVHVLDRSAPLLLERDGQRAGELKAGDCVEFSVGERPAQIMRLHDRGFYERARRKLQLVDSSELAPPAHPERV